MLAVELDPVWSGRLAQRVRDRGLARQVQVVRGDLLTIPLPTGERWRVLASPPYGLTTALLKRLLDDPQRGPDRVDLVLQLEVARKHAAQPPGTLLASTWAPWWEARVVERVPATAFRPVPRVDSAWLRVTRRAPDILRPELAPVWEALLRREWVSRGGLTEPGRRPRSGRASRGRACWTRHRRSNDQDDKEHTMSTIRTNADGSSAALEDLPLEGDEIIGGAGHGGMGGGKVSMNDFHFVMRLSV